MSSSSSPLVSGRNIRPKARDTTLEFWWGYPSSDGGAVISSYTLSCPDPSVSQSVGPSSFYTMVSSLTNGTEYTFQIVADDSTSASSAPAVYRTIAPGSKPSGALSTVVTAIGSGRVAVTWEPPVSDGNAPIGWYVVRSVSSSPSDPIIKVSAYATDSNTIISSLNTASMYSFNVYAVNGPGYSPAVSTLTISPTLGNIFTYIEVYEPDSGSNYAYRIYNSYTDAWNVVESPYTASNYDGNYTSSNFEINYDYYGTSNTFFTGYYSRYNNPSTSYYEYHFEFRNTDGSFLRTISTINNSDGRYLPRGFGNSNTGFFYNSNDITSNYDIQMYQPHTDTYKISSMTMNGNVNDVELLNNGVYFITWDNDHYDHYIWNINSNSPTLITSNYGYNYQNIYGVSTAIFLIGGTIDSNYYDTVTYMNDTTFSSSYSLSVSTYTNINTNQYGVLGDHAFFRGYNSNTSNYDYYVFNQMPSMTPVILSNILSNNNSNTYTINQYYNTNYGGNDYNQTYASDSLLVLNLEGSMNYIANGGGQPLYDFKNLFLSEGNLTAIRLRLEDSTTPVDGNSYLYYGTSLQRSNYGYVVGSINTYPHTSLTYTTAGSNYISVLGNYRILNYNSGNNRLLSTSIGAYTCSNGNYGSYWMQQTGTQFPSSELQPFGADLWYTVNNSNWGSAVAGATYNFNTSGVQYIYSTELYGSNYILCKSLFGSISSISGQWEGTFLDASTIEGFLSVYVNEAPFCDTPSDFTTINVKAFDNWNLSTGYVYYSTLLTTNFPYIYDGNINNIPLAEGTAYLFTASSTSIVSTVFTSNNLCANNFVLINSNGAGFIEQETNRVTAHILTASGEVSTLLSSIEAFAPTYTTTNYNTQEFHDLFYYNINSFNNSSSFLFVLSNDGTLLTSNIISNNISTRFSGRNALIYETDTSNLNIIQQGVLTSTIVMPYADEELEDPYPDFANGQLAITNYDNDSNSFIVTVTNSSISTFTTNFFTGNINSFLLQSFLMIWQSYPFKLLAIDMNTNSEYGFSTIGELYEDQRYEQADSIGFEAIDDNDGARNYVVFNFSTTTFNMLSTSSAENEEYTFTTSPYWYD